jgi:hypothetical protein
VRMSVRLVARVLIFDHSTVARIVTAASVPYRLGAAMRPVERGPHFAIERCQRSR